MVSGFVAAVQGKEIAGKILLAKNSAANERSSCEHLDHYRKVTTATISGKIFWKLLTVKQQTGIQDLATVRLF